MPTKVSLEDNFSEEEIKEFFRKANSRTEAGYLIGYTYKSIKINKKMDKLIKKYNIDISHFGSSKTKFPHIIKVCPVCSKKVETQIGHKDEKTCCSVNCANKYNARRGSNNSNWKAPGTHNREIKRQIKKEQDANKTLTEKYIEYINNPKKKIQKKIIAEITEEKIQEIKEIFVKAKNKKEAADLLGYDKTSGNAFKKVNDLIEKYNIDISHFTAKLRTTIKQHEFIEKTCPVCQKKFEVVKDAKYQKTYCSASCAGIDYKKNINNTQIIEKECPICQKKFQTKIGGRDEKTCCSKACANTYFRSGKNNGGWKEDAVCRQIKCDKITDSGFSADEVKIHDYIKSLIPKIKIIKGDREILSGKELDIYIPKLKLAIEYDGLYWHSEDKGKDKNYHLNKTKLCHEKGIKLIHIFEDEWLYNPKLVKAKLRIELDCFNYSIDITKCTIKEIDQQLAEKFLDKYHIESFKKAGLYLGAYYKNRLVSVSSFSGYRLTRFACINNFKIHGILNMFLKFYNKTSVNILVDRRWNENYFNCFKFVLESEPKCFYFDPHNRNLKFIRETKENKDERYLKIWDCGQLLYRGELNEIEKNAIN